MGFPLRGAGVPLDMGNPLHLRLDQSMTVLFGLTFLLLALTLIHLISIAVTNTPVNPGRSTGVALL